MEAQTLANVYQAIDANHEIVPVLNKVDLPAAEPERVKAQIEEVIGIPADDAVEISAKTGLNIEGVLEAVVTRLPPPTGDAEKPLQAMLIDSWYDPYLGVIVLVRIKEGRLKRGMKVRMMSSGAVHQVDQVGVFAPRMTSVESLGRVKWALSTRLLKPWQTVMWVIPLQMIAARQKSPCRGSNLHSRGVVWPLPRCGR